MQMTIQGKSQLGEYNPHVALSKGIGWGWIGGLVATLVMDLILMGVLPAIGLPAFTCFSIVGDTAARFFAILGIEMAGGIPLGVAAHYLIGPMVGVTFGIALVKVEVFRVNTLKKSLILAILYVEILSQPMLAATPILLMMTAAETLLWFCGSFVMHFIYGVVLGVMIIHGMQMASAPNYK
jgi:hypothetical protein